MLSIRRLGSSPGSPTSASGETESSNSFFVGSLVLDPETDTMRDASDPVGWRYDRDSSVEPGNLFPTDGN